MIATPHRRTVPAARALVLAVLFAASCAPAGVALASAATTAKAAPTGEAGTAGGGAPLR
jgi:hypothetical protein